MLPLKDKELLFVRYGFTVHRPDVQEACIIGAIIALICCALNFRYPFPMVWSLVAIASIGAATFDLIPAYKPLRTLLIGLVIGASLAFVATL